jgi:putative tryptophan/tyrosine transport system substrate-binding protein
MRRREFIMALGGAAAAWPLAARAQQTAMPMVGFVNSGSPGPYAPNVAAFLQGLKEAGYVDGQNVAVEFRWAEGQNDQLPALVADLVRRPVTVIAATSIAAALAAKAATTTIPIIFRTGADPVGLGLVTSLNRPSGNLTGVTSLNIEVGSKRLELLHELVPTAAVMAVLVNPTNPNAERTSKDLETAAHTLGLRLRVLHARTERDLDAALASLVQVGAGGLVISPDAFFASQNENLAALSARYGIPSMHFSRDFVAAGGLMSYGGSFTESFHQTGLYVGRILKGEKAGELPVQQSTKVELVLNLKTAKALGISFPITLLGRADEVIE